jgi:hypothetical protein
MSTQRKQVRESATMMRNLLWLLLAIAILGLVYLFRSSGGAPPLPVSGPPVVTAGSSREGSLGPLVGEGENIAKEHREAAKAVAASLRDAGDDPKEFSCQIEASAEGQLIFHLWHESAFLPENRDVRGNPGGRCRDVYYDPAQKKVVKTLWWQ